MAHDDLCEELAAWQQVLCIVNTRKRAQEIYSDLPREGRFHLSTLMYPVHRQEMLAHIRERLRSGQPCRVVSTSLIEAGVDVDFPAVYRELTGLDSIVQAAGRCNREGKRAVQDSTVTVFEADGAVPQLLKVNIGAAREAMAAFEDIGSPPAIERYFRAYRSLVGSGIDKSNAIRHLTQGISGCLFPFDAVAKNFRMIETDTRTVYIPCAQSRPLINAMVAGKATKETYRLAGRYGVNVYEQHYLALLRAGDVLPIDAGSAYLVNESLYSVDTGLSLRTDSGKAEFI
jgi:CRISPR-associated endonuclease/helicase Cas3